MEEEEEEDRGAPLSVAAKTLSQCSCAAYSLAGSLGPVRHLTQPAWSPEVEQPTL